MEWEELRVEEEEAVGQQQNKKWLYNFKITRYF